MLKMGKYHRSKNENEHANAHEDASEEHHAAVRGGGWQSQMAREASIRANEKSGLNKGFARDTADPTGRAASIAFVTPDGKVLLVRRSRRRGKLPRTLVLARR